MSSAPASVSLLVSTYNWPRALELVLERVRGQQVHPLEVVIADDGSRDDTRCLIERLAPGFPVPLVHVWHEDTGFRLAASRNKGIAAARGDYIVQIDGDILLHPAFIAAHAAVARRGVWVQGSRALLNASCTGRLLDGTQRHVSGLSAGVKQRQNALYVPWLASFVRGPRDGLTRVRGAHMAFWRDDLVRVNGYDERIEGWGREDSELATRLINAGVHRRNLKFAAVAYHLWHTSANFDSVTRNHQRLERTIHDRLVWAELGLDQYLAREQVA
ncbi:glycosyltransferase family 2 protein [Gemmatimonas sp.]|uniref:glycosyltransferase family 2 protein n=1 Tax=Gemmatimonas sp. TaxID=1962908 RepID=UPI0039833158